MLVSGKLNKKNWCSWFFRADPYSLKMTITFWFTNGSQNPQYIWFTTGWSTYKYGVNPSITFEVTGQNVIVYEWSIWNGNVNRSLLVNVDIRYSILFFSAFGSCLFWLWSVFVRRVRNWEFMILSSSLFIHTLIVPYTFYIRSAAVLCMFGVEDVIFPDSLRFPPLFDNEHIPNISYLCYFCSVMQFFAVCITSAEWSRACYYYNCMSIELNYLMLIMTLYWHTFIIIVRVVNYNNPVG